jgi:Helix-turn-helix domain
MTNSEILAEASQELPRLIPRWLRTRHAVAYSGLSRSKLYELFGSGRIKAANVRDKGSRKGVRVFDRESIDEFLERQVG